MAWAEDPPSRTRHHDRQTSNSTARPGPELTVYSNFIVYRSRAESEEDFYVGRAGRIYCAASMGALEKSRSSAK